MRFEYLVRKPERLVAAALSMQGFRDYTTLSLTIQFQHNKFLLYWRRIVYIRAVNPQEVRDGRGSRARETLEQGEAYERTIRQPQDGKATRRGLNRTRLRRGCRVGMSERMEMDGSCVVVMWRVEEKGNGKWTTRPNDIRWKLKCDSGTNTIRVGCPSSQAPGSVRDLNSGCTFVQSRVRNH